MAAHAPYIGPGAMGAAGAAAKGECGKGAVTTLQAAKNTALPPDMDEWELSEGGLTEGSTLSGSKALLADYPEDEAISKQTKNQTTSKGKRGNTKKKA